MPANPLCLLDNIRFGNGTQGMMNYYRELLKNDRGKALELINDRNLKFGSLYQLRRECSTPGVADSLNTLYRKALQVTAALSGSVTRQSEARMRSDGDNTYDALKWMIKTGFDEEDIGNDYDRLMERSAALLTRSFRDKDVLPEIAEMIYSRYRSGKLIHELVWAFFEARRPESLNLIVQRLVSPDSRDVILTRKLLCFIPFINETGSMSANVLYNRAMAWLQENVPFLYYTGESLHLSGQPILYAVAPDAKYLCRPVSSDNGELLAILNPFEKKLAEQFNELPENLRSLLADFSYALYRVNFDQWCIWIQLPLADQLNRTKRYMGGLE